MTAVHPADRTSDRTSDRAPPSAELHSEAPRTLAPASASDNMLLEIRPPSFTPFLWRFVDPQEERDFCNSDLGPKYAHRIQMYGALLAALCLVVTLAEAIASDGRSPVWAMTLPIALLYAGLAALGWLHRRTRVTVCAMEVASIATFVLHSLVHAISASDRFLEQLFGMRAALPWWSSGNLTFRLSLLPVLTGIMLPSQPRSYAVFLCAVMIQAVFFSIVAPPVYEPLADTVANLFALGVVLGSLFLGRVHIVVARRSTFHFRREVGISVARAAFDAREREELQRLDEQNKVELLTANAAKNARSRLIRMVMHDLRSPLLSVSNLSLALRAMAPATVLSEPAVLAQLNALHTCATLMEHIVRASPPTHTPAPSPLAPGDADTGARARAHADAARARRPLAARCLTCSILKGSTLVGSCSCPRPSASSGCCATGSRRSPGSPRPRASSCAPSPSRRRSRACA